MKSFNSIYIGTSLTFSKLSREVLVESPRFFNFESSSSLNYMYVLGIATVTNHSVT